MSENRLTDYLDHMQQAATDACGFVEGLAKENLVEQAGHQRQVVRGIVNHQNCRPVNEIERVWHTLSPP